MEMKCLNDNGQFSHHSVNWGSIQPLFMAWVILNLTWKKNQNRRSEGIRILSLVIQEIINLSKTLEGESDYLDGKGGTEPQRFTTVEWDVLCSFLHNYIKDLIEGVPPHLGHMRWADLSHQEWNSSF